MTTVYLAWSANTSCHDTLRWHADREPVDVLVAFPELHAWEKKRHEYNIGRWVLDSGAFSAWKSGRPVRLADFIAACKDTDAAEIFGLDVINDYEATRRNLEAMWSAGIPAIPTYHQSSPIEALDWCCKHSDKIALSAKGKSAGIWVQKCFAHIYPKKVHGFAMASWKALARAPFHSVDASSWLFSPAKMGNWAGYSGTQQRVGVANKIGEHFKRDFWVEVEEHQKRSRWAAFRWRNQLKEMEQDG